MDRSSERVSGFVGLAGSVGFAGFVGLIGLTLAGWASPALSTEYRPFEFRFGQGVRVIPQLTTQQVYDSNLSATVGAAEDAWLTMLEPRLIVEARPELNQYRLDLISRHGNYRGKKVARDDFWDIELALSTNRQSNLDREFELNYTFSRVRDYEDPISGAHYDIDQRYHRNFLSAQFKTGAYYSPLQLDLWVQGYDLAWETNRSQTRSGDHQQIESGFLSRYAALSQADWLFSGLVSVSQLPYDEDVQGIYLRALTGASWRGLEPIEGRFQLGFGRVDPYGNSEIIGKQRLMWEASLDWNVQERHSIIAEALRRFRLPELTPQWQLETLYRIQWRQQWQESYSSRLSVGFQQLQSLESMPTDLREDNFFLNLNLSYDFSRWLRLGAGYHYGTEALGNLAQRIERHRLLASAQLAF